MSPLRKDIADTLKDASRERRRAKAREASQDQEWMSDMQEYVRRDCNDSRHNTDWLPVRRIKCDETKPDCRRCSVTGRKCDGYELLSPNDSLNLSPDDSHAVIPYAPMVDTGPAKEQRAFFYFKERTIGQLSCFYACDFWDSVILQAAFVDPGIRHAIIALGSLHEEFSRSGDAESLVDDFGIKQYNLAIREHLDALTVTENDHSSVDNYLASSVVFICIELLQGHYISAFSLIKRAVKLFYDRDIDGWRTSAWPVKILESILARFQAQAIGLLGTHIVGETVPPHLVAPEIKAIPKTFRSIAEAKECFEFYQHLHLLSGHDHGPNMAHDPAYYASRIPIYQDILSRWSSAFDNLLANLGDNLSEKDRRGIDVLKLWRINNQTNMDMARDHGHMNDDQTLWDLYMDRFEGIVSIAESVTNSEDFGNRTSHLFTIDFGIVGPLYDVARMCRDPFIRRRAINVLRRSPSREGLWDSLLAARAAERQMELEESVVSDVRFAGDIPGWARITTLVPTFKFGERWTAIELTRQKSDPQIGPAVFNEIIEW